MAGIFSTFLSSTGIEETHPIKRQIFETSIWFIRLRWSAIIMLVGAGFLARPLGFSVPLLSIVTIAAYLFGANLILWFIARRYLNPYVNGLRLNIFTNVQIWVDWLAVLAVIHFTGGITSPVIYFFFLHLVMAAILLPATHIYINTVVVVICMAVLLWAEATGVLGVHSLAASSVTRHMQSDGKHIFGVFVLMSASFFILVFLTSQAAELLRRRMRQLHITKT